MLKNIKNEKRKSKLPLISIVIPVLNSESTLNETLESVITQDYPYIQVIVQDGLSSDRSINIARSFQERYPSIFNVYSQKDKGQYDAINKGFKKTKGDVLAFINADDRYAPGALITVGNYFRQYNPLWAAGKGRVVNKRGEEIAKIVTMYKSILLSINNYSLLIMVNYLMQPSVFLSKKAYQEFGPFIGTKKFLKEYDLWLKLGGVQMPDIIPAVLSEFRITGTTISATQFETLLADDIATAKRYTDNQTLILLRRLHNLGRVIFLRFLT